MDDSVKYILSPRCCYSSVFGLCSDIVIDVSTHDFLASFSQSIIRSQLIRIYMVSKEGNDFFLKNKVKYRVFPLIHDL